MALANSLVFGPMSHLAEEHISRVLVVGCGGLGSETVKLLNTIGLLITVIDYDVVETSNLNRQFFFQNDDVGKYKTDVVSCKTGAKGMVRRVEDLKSTDLDDFDIVFLCLDSVTARMQMNYIFVKSKCKMLIDCGVEGFKAHAKRVTHGVACLYCIKELYTVENESHICSLKSVNQEITAGNRDQVLRSMIFQMREIARGNRNIQEIYHEIVEKFNGAASSSLQTTSFEVEGIFNNVIPNVCTINSIGASLGVILAFHTKDEDFIYFDAQNDVFFQVLRLERDSECFVCSKASSSS